MKNFNSRSGCDEACGERNCNTRNRRMTANAGGYASRESERDRQGVRVDCDCEITSTVNSRSAAPPPMPRTQFPYLDVEPRTCGCEEKPNN